MNSKQLQTLSATLMAAGLAALLCSCPAGPAGSSMAAEGTTVQEPAEPARPTYADVLQALDSRIASQEVRCRDYPESWPDLEGLANSYRSRSMLSGSNADALRAETVLKQAFAAAPEGSGPFLSRAALNFWLHRVNEVEADLQSAEKAILLKAATRAQIAALRADVHYHNSRYSQALAGFKAAVEDSPSVESYSRLADYYWHSGEMELAQQMLGHALGLADPGNGQQLAWIHQQRGMLEMDRARYDSAMAHFEQADSALPGWWQVAANIARVQAAQGHFEESHELWERIVRDTRNADCLDELARIKLEMGDTAGAGELIAEARALYNAQIAAAPEAAYGHAVDHWMSFVEDPREVVRVARENFNARPTGSAHIKLTQALQKAGETREARSVIEAALASPYRSPDLHATAASLYTMLGEGELATKQYVLLHELSPDYSAHGYHGHSH